MKNYRKKIDRNYLAILGIVLIVFIISINIAWLNPRPEFTVKTHPKIPIMWQYNVDVSHEFLSAAYFPEFYKKNNLRIDRPLYSMLIKLFGETAGLVISPFYELNILARGIIGYVIYKLLIFFLAAILLFRLARRWFDEKISLLAVAVAFFHPFTLFYMSCFVTSETQLINPIIIAYLFFQLADNYSRRRNIFYSFLVGLLMLIKNNYAIYLSLLLFSFIFKKKYRETLLSFAVHLLPLGLWLLFTKLYGLAYYNHEIQKAGMGIWIFNNLLFQHPVVIFQTVLFSLEKFLFSLLKYFHIFLFIALLSVGYDEIKKKLNKDYIIFILIFIFMTWAQFFASKSYAIYRVSDLAFIIYPLSIYAIYTFLKAWRLEKNIKFLVVIYLVLNLICMVRIPWIHPYDQVDILKAKQDEIGEMKQGNLNAYKKDKEFGE